MSKELPARKCLALAVMMALSGAAAAGDKGNGPKSSAVNPQIDVPQIMQSYPTRADVRLVPGNGNPGNGSGIGNANVGNGNGVGNGPGKTFDLSGRTSDVTKALAAGQGEVDGKGKSAKSDADGKHVKSPKDEASVKSVSSDKTQSKTTAETKSDAATEAAIEAASEAARRTIAYLPDCR